MRIYFEASVDEEHQGSFDVNEELVAEYEALTTDAERHAWLEEVVHEAVYDGDHSAGRSIENCEWRVEQ